MQIRSLLKPLLNGRPYRFGGKKKQAEPLTSVNPNSRDEVATRRAVLTGGLAVAGASTLASATAEAAITYVKLGLQNNTTGITNVVSTGAKGLAGVSKVSNGIGVHGFCNFSGGTGVAGTATGNGYGVRGTGGYNGVYGSGGSYGVIGSAASGYGVYGSGETAVYASGGTYGVQAYGSSYGVYGSSSSYGVFGQGGSYGVVGSGATGVYGSSASGDGVYGTTSHPNTSAVHGIGGQYGVSGGSARTAGVRGDSGYVGVWGEGNDWGFFSIATATTGQNYGIMAETKSPAGFAGYFKGPVYVTGTLFKGGGAFRIDHPLDPERKWLQHSFVESPDMMNVYNGNVTTDSSGLATVKLPAYFGALNRDFRYQLTVIGKMAQAIVDREIDKNQFRIRTSQGNVKVSWQVTGIRKDDYAKAHPIVVELRKRREDVGTRQFLPPGVNGRLMTTQPSDAPLPGAGRR
jgi:hypothetical protein